LHLLILKKPNFVLLWLSRIDSRHKAHIITLAVVAFVILRNPTIMLIPNTLQVLPV
jgi:hypothetical protein